MKLLLSALTTGNKGERLMVADVKRAYFHARSKRLTYVKLPPEDIGPGEEGMCGRLNFSMYGTRDAAAVWTEYILRYLCDELRSTRGCVFHLQARCLRRLVHGDDFVVFGPEDPLRWFREKLIQQWLIKFRGMLGWIPRTSPS